jgi:hypothetical protein
MRYRVKPVHVDAIRWDGDNFQEIVGFVIEGSLAGRVLKSVKIDYGVDADAPPTPTVLTVTMHDGSTITTAVGDWVVRGDDLQIRSLSSNVFSATYDRDVGPD